MRMPAERPSSSLMFFRLFSASSTVLPGAKNTNQTLSDVCRRGCASVCVSPYVRKSLTSSTVSSPVVSKVRSAQLRGESSGVSMVGEERELGCSSSWPGKGGGAGKVHSVTLVFWLVSWKRLEEHPAMLSDILAIIYFDFRLASAGSNNPMMILSNALSQNSTDWVRLLLEGLPRDQNIEGDGKRSTEVLLPCLICFNLVSQCRQTHMENPPLSPTDWQQS